MAPKKDPNFSSVIKLLESSSMTHNEIKYVQYWASKK